MESFTANRRPLDHAVLRALSAKSDLPGLVRAGSHFGMILLLGWLIWLVSSRHGLLWALPLMVAQGFFVAFLFVAMHECAHKTAFRTRWLNTACGQLAAVLIAQPFEYYILFHWEHHRHTQDPDRDPELLVAVPTNSETRIAIAYTGLIQVAARLRLMARHAMGDVFFPWVPAGKKKLVVREARIYLGIYALALLGSIAAGSAVLLWAWVLPWLMGQFMLRPYLYAEHVGCEETRSAFENTRTTRTNAFLRWFAWNMPYHVEHHAYPSVPFHALPALHRAVEQEITFHGKGYPQVTRETWSWFRSRQRGESASSVNSRA
ncbi:fatty acid desaturase [Roseococcus sp. YIM B11640]|uniref:fatty acid desaturase n=1 Tax=Roseococcus sp. YIM B11640 TaxID=3133973 RepID=UPI003C7C4615